MSFYNPQDWARNGPTNGVHVPHSRLSPLGGAGSPRDMTGMESSMPEPPPPYFTSHTSAGRNAAGTRPSPSMRSSSFQTPQRLSPTLARSEYSTPTTATVAASGNLASMQQPIAPMQRMSPTLFPPPPSTQRDRSSSRARGVLNNLSAWASKHKVSDVVPTPPISMYRCQSYQGEIAIETPILSTPLSNVSGLASAAPAARRAVSVGYLGQPLAQSGYPSTGNPATNNTLWMPGMALPPPPPGPPPPSSRSQSLGRAPYLRESPNGAEAAYSTRGVARGNTLGSVPPTPLDWTDGDEKQLQLQVVTGVSSHGPEQRRDPSSRSIRERRNESRARSREHQRIVESQTNQDESHFEGQKPANLILLADSNLIGRRRRVNKASASPRSIQSKSLSAASADVFGDSAHVGEDKVSNQSPDINQGSMPHDLSILTPPFTPANNQSTIESSHVRGQSGTPVDHFQASLERYKSHLKRESAAATDSDRLRLFTEFIVIESRLRRDRYSGAFSTMEDEILGLTQGLWKPLERSDYSYQPRLSPILSTTMSPFPDDQDSRGRPASRWWEPSSSSDSIGGDGNQKFKRSLRESKYMGLPREERQSMQATSKAYRPEINDLQVGWNEPETTPRSLHLVGSGPATPRPKNLDVSRLITLPPPYPRHHPALHNNHPRLAVLRAELRSLNDRHPSDTMLIEQGLAAEEINVYSSEAFRHHCDSLATKINKASGCLEKLKKDVETANESNTPNRTQEGGDDQPELLELVTLMKWFFEAREQLHKELYSVRAESEDTLKRVSLRSHASAGHDMRTRTTDLYDWAGSIHEINHETQSLQRHEDWERTVQVIISRGVEDQLCAFWDIAPPIFAILQATRSSLRDLNIEIPPQEYEENPSYRAFPLQYFYTLLVHAEKSTYQLIDSQANLFCLLHEIKMSTMIARGRLTKAHRAGNRIDPADSDQETEAMRRQEDNRLTRELQKKVEMVEEQWRSALGDELRDCKELVMALLLEQGGWHERLNDY